MPETAPPRVFISYSHDSPEHGDRVLELADRLRADGIDAIIDQYIPSPPEGWPEWSEVQIREADFVLMVCTETYLRRVNGEEEPGKGHGVHWEGRLSKQQIYDAGSSSRKFIPVLFADGPAAHVPDPVKGGTIYKIEATESYEALLRLLTYQPLTPMPPLGRRRSLPPRGAASWLCFCRAIKAVRLAAASACGGSVRRAPAGARCARGRYVPGEWNAPAGGCFGDGWGREVIPGGPVLLGKCGSLSGWVCAAGA